MQIGRQQTYFLLLFTLAAFATNSILCRMALMSYSIGPMEFTLIRLMSGMLILLPILFIYRQKNQLSKDRAKVDSRTVIRTNVLPSLALFSYALFFSLAYVQLDAGTGALILFAAVQISMIGISIYLGSRLNLLEWFGFFLAFTGLVYLLSPGLSAPPLAGASLMLLSGFSWGVYSLLGKNVKQPILSTARNFLLCAPGCILLLIIVFVHSNSGKHSFNLSGIVLAVISGAVTSGLGYVLWYITLRRLTTTIASIAQLAVPVIAGFGGVLFLNEHLSLRLIFASGLIFGGIVVTILGKNRSPIAEPNPE